MNLTLTSTLFRRLSLLAFSLVAAIGFCADGTAPKWGKAADNHIYAQKLVNELMAAHPELLVVGLHTVAPGASEQTMIATNLDRVGKADDDDDVAVYKERKMILVPNAKESNKFEVQMPMLDATGKIIGAYGFVFLYKAGDDEVEILRKAKAIRAALAAQIPSHEALFKPMP